MEDPPRLPEQDLAAWRRAADGDDRARTALIESAWRLAEVRLRTFTADEREEIRQEIAESVLRALATGLSPESNLAGFLEWRGRAEIIQFVRKKMRSPRSMPLDDALDAAGPAASPLRTTELGELWSMVELCRDAIANRNHRRAWTRRFVDGLEPREIAIELDAAPELVRTWIARGTASVRACLERKMPPGGER